jgi:hypothetical protein
MQTQIWHDSGLVLMNADTKLQTTKPTSPHTVFVVINIKLISYMKAFLKFCDAIFPHVNSTMYIAIRTHPRRFVSSPVD